MMLKTFIIAIVNSFYNVNKTKGCMMISILVAYYYILTQYKPFKSEKFM